jgi:hypothetical protein
MASLEGCAHCAVSGLDHRLGEGHGYPLLVYRGNSTPIARCASSLHDKGRKRVSRRAGGLVPERARGRGPCGDTRRLNDMDPCPPIRLRPPAGVSVPSDHDE